MGCNGRDSGWQAHLLQEGGVARVVQARQPCQNLRFELPDVVQYVINRLRLRPALVLVKIRLELLFSFVGVDDKLRPCPES